MSEPDVGYPDPSQQDVMQWVRSKGLDSSIDGRLKKLGEEVGEVFGAIVAMQEGREGKFDIAQELAQTFMCLLGLAEAASVDLNVAVRAEWHEMQHRVWEHLERPRPVRPPRAEECIKNWPDCIEGEYDPRCCRFPKSCSCDIFDPVETK